MPGPRATRVSSTLSISFFIQVLTGLVIAPAHHAPSQSQCAEAESEGSGALDFCDVVLGSDFVVAAVLVDLHVYKQSAWKDLVRRSIANLELDLCVSINFASVEDDDVRWHFCICFTMACQGDPFAVEPKGKLIKISLHLKRHLSLKIDGAPSRNAQLFEECLICSRGIFGV